MTAGSWKPRGFAQNLAVCLDPYYAWPCDRLTTQAAAGPPLFRRDDQDTVEQFMQDWLTTIKGLASAGEGE
jgi:hypothetical protein